LADRTKFFKETPEGVEYMCKAMEDRINERVKVIVVKMIEDGNLSFEQIADYTDLTVDQVKKIAEEFKLVSA
jgi:predicted HTH domain antitoxin